MELEKRRSSGSGALATANEGLSGEVARLRSDKVKLEEVLAGKNTELETALGALKETRQRLEEARQQSERDRAELAFRLGREAGLASLASAVVGGGRKGGEEDDGEEEEEEEEEDVDGEERGPATPARGDTTNTSTIPLASRLLTAKRGDLGNTSSSSSSSSSSTVAATAASSSSAAALTFSSSLSSLYEENDPGASVASTTALLAKHEQLRQQELGLLALKQQHAQQRLMATTQARQAALMQSYAAAAGFPSFGSGLDFATASLPFASPHVGYPGGPMGAAAGAAASLSTPMGAGVGGRGAYTTAAAAATASRAGSAAAGVGLGVGGQQQQQQQQGYQGQQQQQQQQQQGAGGMSGVEGGERGMQHLVMSPNGNLEVSAASLLPAEAGGVPMCIEVAEEPAGGWSVYQYPPYPAKWPLTMAFFAPLVDPGIPIIKHGE